MAPLELFRAAAAYFALLFVAGFVLGTIRLVFVSPRLGADLSRIIELPIMVGISIAVARWIVRHYGSGARFAAWLAVGLAAFAMLMVVEFVFGRITIGFSVAEYLAGFATRAGGLGLAAQALIIVWPALMAAMRSS